MSGAAKRARTSTRWTVALALRLVTPLLATSLLATSLLGCTREPPPPPASIGVAPAFETKTLDGEDVKLESYRGQVVLLNVWATWCEPCVREFPVLSELHEKLADKGFTVIGLNADVRSKLSEVRTMVVHHKLPFPIWLDFESKAQVVFKLRGYPTTFLIDREGNIRWKREGEIGKNDPELGQVIESVLAESAGQ